MPSPPPSAGGALAADERHRPQWRRISLGWNVLGELRQEVERRQDLIVPLGTRLHAVSILVGKGQLCDARKHSVRYGRANPKRFLDAFTFSREQVMRLSRRSALQNRRISYLSRSFLATTPRGRGNSGAIRRSLSWQHCRKHPSNESRGRHADR
jgi:hypothetical protein